MQLHVLVQPVFQIITVKIEITDVNDNAPMFPVKEVGRFIAESASLRTSISIPPGIYQDSNAYGIKCYDLLPDTQDVFSLKVTHLVDESTHLQLVLLKRLNPDDQDSYQVEVVASDGGNPPKSGSIIINIKVNRTADNFAMAGNDGNNIHEETETTSTIPADITDGHFRFEKDAYDIKISEETDVTSVIGNVSVLGDYPEGGITYLFKGKTSYFEIHSDTGAISLNNQLDYEHVSSYELIVVAALNSSGTLTLTQASVIVHVLDVNDNSPIISFPNYRVPNARVYENEMIGVSVEVIKVVDADSGVNGFVECSSNSTDFNLERVSDTEYILVTAVVFDRESKDDYSLQLVCEDGGNVPRKAEIIFPVLILDRNDNAPQFTLSLYYAEINDIDSVADFELTVSTSDIDKAYNARIMYHIDGENDAFQIAEESGVIRPNVYDDYDYHGILFYEDLSTMILPIIASDSGNPAFKCNCYCFHICL